ncbi:hypothetical protein niasHS_006966 [Heterodera schachtii]|uniref:Uncharacterized protein n=1 Tax=Heterodera schachtii TaxID=97005 RepID=A0ABD2JF88_HETSC
MASDLRNAAVSAVDELCETAESCTKIRAFSACHSPSNLSIKFLRHPKFKFWFTPCQFPSLLSIKLLLSPVFSLLSPQPH